MLIDRSTDRWMYWLAPILKTTSLRWCPGILSNFKLIGGSILEFENQNVDGQTHGQVATLTSTSFKRNVAQVVSYHAVIFQIDQSGYQNLVRQKHGQMDTLTGTNFESKFIY